METQKKLFVLDISNLAYRAFFAFSTPPLTNLKGDLTSVAYGVACAINRIVQDYHPDYIVAARDMRDRTFRHEMYPQYKANRGEPNMEYVSQLPMLEKLLAAYGIQTVGVSGFEADDVIGTITTKYASNLLQVTIVSSDKDFMQLLNKNVYFCKPQNGGGYTLHGAEVSIEKFSCFPDQVVDCLALIGDTADNIPGVRGIGEKGAAALVKSFGSLDGIYNSLGFIKPKMAQKLLQDRQNAYLSKSLATIKVDVPFELDVEKVSAEGMLRRPEVIKFYAENDFDSLMGAGADITAEAPDLGETLG